MTAREGMMPMQSITGRLQSGCRACLSGGPVFVSALTLTFMLTMTSAFMPGAVGLALAADWNPAAFAEEDTLEFFTVNAEGEEHWATVWFVLIDGEPYIRLGARAQERITQNINRPIVRIRVGGQTYEDIRVEEVPERNDEVAIAMGDKYWSAGLMRYMPERYTGRLTPASAGSE